MNEDEQFQLTDDDRYAPDPTVTALIDKYDALSEPLANRAIGTITTDITRTPSAAGESALGDIIADAQLEATASMPSSDIVIEIFLYNQNPVTDEPVAVSTAAGGARGFRLEAGHSGS